MKIRTTFFPPFSGLLSVILTATLFLTLSPAAFGMEEGYNVYLGQLHSHSGQLDLLGVEGYGPEEAYAAAKEAGMDFFALTDYSHSLNDTYWAEGKAGAEGASDENFAAIYGCETVISGVGHVALYNTRSWHLGETAEFRRLKDCYEALAEEETALGMFCHPGTAHGDFEGFGRHTPAYDGAMELLEVWGEGGKTYFEAYHTALTAGWHVAPTASGVSHEGNWDASPVRTGVLAPSLTEADILQALRARRVYATADPDLKLSYRLDGHWMGSVAASLSGFTAEVELAGAGTGDVVQIIGETGDVLCQRDLSSDAETVELTVPAGQSFYYVRILRENEVAAVTAPVWVELGTDYGISDFTAGNTVPVQGQGLTFSASLYNHEAFPLVLDSVRLLAGQTLVWTADGSLELPPLETHTLTADYTHTGSGSVEFTLQATGTISGQPVALSEKLTLSYTPAVLTAQVLVDGRHGDVEPEQMDNLKAVAAELDMTVSLFRDELPEDGEILILPPPKEDYSQEEIKELKEFLQKGGVLVLCGKAGDNGVLNGILSALGSTMVLNEDTAFDHLYNDGSPEHMYTDVVSITEGVYHQRNGCTVDPGNGTCLAKTRSGGLPLLAAEDVGAGQIYLAGSMFLDDDHMRLPRNRFEEPTANQLFLTYILRSRQSSLEVTAIGEVRKGSPGELYRVRGYITAGTREGNRFPNLIYIQDDSGGIAVSGVGFPSLQVGQGVELTGQLALEGKNPTLECFRLEVMENDLYRHDPEKSSNREAKNYDLRGGQILLIEGTARNLQFTADGLGVCRFTVQDDGNESLDVVIGEEIRSGSTGQNRLAEEIAEEQGVRVWGILHMQEDGTPVLRVRNCDEVVLVPPLPTPPEKNKGSTNPRTGDCFFTMEAFLRIMGLK